MLLLYDMNVQLHEHKNLFIYTMLHKNTYTCIEGILAILAILAT